MMSLALTQEKVQADPQQCICCLQILPPPSSCTPEGAHTIKTHLVVLLHHHLLNGFLKVPGQEHPVPLHPLCFK